ncbi:MAG: AsmA family protein, partial [Bacteroidetes bacterium]|nr:AsmA family protein [Bacteroidota bacterium]
MKKILVILLAIILLLTAAVVIAPYFFKDDIINYIKNETVNATLEFDEDIELTLFSSFPDVSLGINNVKVINKEPFVGDTLISFQSFKTTIDLWSAIKGDYIVKSVDLIKPVINVQVKKDGSANYDIALESDKEPTDEAPEEESTSEDSYKLQLEHLSIQDANIIYNDSSLATFAELNGFNFSMNGVFDPEEMDINTLLQIAKTTVAYDGVTYLNKAETNFKAGYEIRLDKDEYVIKENELAINKVLLSFDGTVAMPTDDVDMDLTFGLKRTAFKDLLSLVPAVYAKDFEGLSASGDFDFNGMLKGKYTDTSYPIYNVDFGIKDGAFKYPDMPTALNNVQLTTKVYSKEEGDLDKMVVDVSKLSFKLDEEPFVASAFATNLITDPDMAANLKGKIDLGRVQGLIDLEGTNMAGVVDADVSVKGRLSAIDQERYEDFKAEGFIGMQNVVYVDVELPVKMEISKGRLEFNPANAAIPFFDMKMGESDLSMNGEVSNYMAYVMRDDTLNGSLNLVSNFLTIDPWMEDEEESSTEETASSEDGAETTGESADEPVVAIPGNINFIVKSNLAKVVYDTYVFDDFVGNITMANERMTFDEISLKMLAGQVIMNGFYDTKNINHPKSSFAFNMKGVSIPGMATTFNTVEQLMPIASKMEGNVDGRLAFNSELDNEYFPVYSSLYGDGKLEID